MNILLFTFQFPPRIGGVETMAYQLGCQLNLLGVRVSVLAEMEPGAFEFDSHQPIAIRRIELGATETLLKRVWQKIRLMIALHRVIRETVPDVVLCLHWDACAYLTWFITRPLLKPLPYVVVAHGMELVQLPEKGFRRWLKSVLRSVALNNAQRIIAVSNFTRQRALKIGCVPAQVIVIPNGVSLSFNSLNEHRSRILASPKVLLTLSRLVPRKGHATILRALPRVLLQVPNLLYKVAGDGPELGRLKTLAHQLGIERNVDFCGAISEIKKAELLADSDIFVLPCRESPVDFEGFGIAILEAMEQGLPVIVGRSGGTAELVINGRTGLLVHPDHVDAWAEAVLDLLQNPDKALRLGQAARRVVYEVYGWEKIARRYLSELEYIAI